MASYWLLSLQFVIAISRRVSETINFEADGTGLVANEEYSSANRNFSTYGHPKSTFKVMQYNILAKALGNNREPWFLFGAGVTQEERKRVKERHVARDPTTGKFKYTGFEQYAADLSAPKQKKISEVSDEVFAWEGEGGRGERLAKEIGEALCEIVILQEVDAWVDSDNSVSKGLFSMIEKYASRKLKIPRDTAATVVSGVLNLEARLDGTVYNAFLARRGRRPDGVAILWRTDRFRLLAKDRKEFTTDHDRIFCMALLEDKLNGQRVLVIGTHLERNPEAMGKAETRRQQIMELVNSIRAVGGNKYDAVILTGDMNSDALETKWEPAAAMFEEQTAVPPFEDVFDSDALPKNADLCTSRTEERLVLIDYIFYSPHSLRVAGKWGPEKCPKAAIPDEKHPSDHIPLVAEFSWGEGPKELADMWKSWKNLIVAQAQSKPKPPMFRQNTERLLQENILAEAAEDSWTPPALRRVGAGRLFPKAWESD